MPERHATPEACSRREALDDWLAGADGLVLGLDFDGTLAPIVEDHAEAAMTTESRAAVDRLAEHSGVGLAVVSGRALEDLTGRVGLDGVVYAGNHGLELGYDGERTVHPAVEGVGPAIDRLCAELDDRLGDVPGYAVENKRVTATVHFRTVPEEHVPRVVGTVEEAVDGADGLRVSEGREIREIRPAVEWDKGRVMELLAATAPDGWRVMYVGDDTTDEDAFRAIQPDGVGVHVTSSEHDDVETDADYRLDGQADVPRFLEWLDDSVPRSDSSRGDRWPAGETFDPARLSDPDGSGS
ncbi:trehalose-phosphatase [Salinirubellus sp. GCM10025818]|uniref:trehalose-phosphatase n=1 Tax=Salinirubellus TaxID=2162630 RepID=UPI0030D25E5D